jgi:hypothetical protein
LVVAAVLLAAAGTPGTGVNGGGLSGWRALIDGLGLRGLPAAAPAASTPDAADPGVFSRLAVADGSKAASAALSTLFSAFSSPGRRKPPIPLRMLFNEFKLFTTWELLSDQAKDVLEGRA